MKILSFAASNSRHSINRKLLNYTESLLADFDIEHLDLNDYEMPIYSIDREHESGIPDLAKQFVHAIAQADALLISFAEHNGNYTVAYKNILDWCSRLDRNIYQNKPILLLSTSPGQGGGGRVLSMAENAIPYFSGTVIGTLSVPSFNENFDVDHGMLVNETLIHQLTLLTKRLRETIQTQ